MQFRSHLCILKSLYCCFEYEGICMMFGCGIPDLNEKKDNALQPKLILRT